MEEGHKGRFWGAHNILFPLPRSWLHKEWLYVMCLNCASYLCAFSVQKGIFHSLRNFLKRLYRQVKTRCSGNWMGGNKGQTKNIISREQLP